MERSEVRTIMEIAKQVFMEDAPKAAAAMAPEYTETKCCGGGKRGSKPVSPGCSVPLLAVYFVFSDCVVINNGACPEWDFCNAVAAR